MMVPGSGLTFEREGIGSYTDQLRIEQPQLTKSLPLLPLHL
jgi:hypothetical protein